MESKSSENKTQKIETPKEILKRLEAISQVYISKLDSFLNPNSNDGYEVNKYPELMSAISSSIKELTLMKNLAKTHSQTK